MCLFSFALAQSSLFVDWVNGIFESINRFVGSFLFFDLLFFVEDVRIPLIVVWLSSAAFFLTIYFGFINFRAFGHAIAITLGRYDRPGDHGEISHFRALTMALSATVGLGNIAGVAVAVSIGGPGATFWMITMGLMGMTSKFSECSLGIMYRRQTPDGSVSGGPMEYLRQGFQDRGHPQWGRFLALLFAFLCMGGALSAGGAFQVNQSLNAITNTLPFLEDYKWVYGVLVSLIVGLVILGGLQRISHFTSKVVPFMCGVYVFSCLYVILSMAHEIPQTLWTIVTSALSSKALYGGFWGTLIVGFQRAVFSNEAGVGSAAIAHATARTQYPIQEGIVALLEPFIDTVVICTLTALVIIMTGAYENPDYMSIIESKQGAALTSKALEEVISWFPYVLSLSVFLFALSTIISWSYYGERCFSYLFGPSHSYIFKITLLVVVFLGSIASSSNVLEFGDLMMLGMSLPNILGIYLLLGPLKKELNSYWGKLQSGKIQRQK